MLDFKLFAEFHYFFLQVVSLWLCGSYCPYFCARRMWFDLSMDESSFSFQAQMICFFLLSNNYCF